MILEPTRMEIAPRVAAGRSGIAVTVDVVIFSIRPGGDGRSELQVLLVERRDAPSVGRWGLPGGFVRPDEGLSTAAARTLAEATGLRSTYLEQLYTFGLPDRDPRGRAITVAYYALVRVEELESPIAREADGVRWCSVERLVKPLAFDHVEVIGYALWRLRNKVSYAHVAFQFLPATFTLAQLRAVYEVILGRKLDPTNFRRHVEATATIVPTKERVAGGRHRPPRLYRCAVEPNALYRGPAA